MKERLDELLDGLEVQEQHAFLAQLGHELTVEARAYQAEARVLLGLLEVLHRTTSSSLAVATSKRVPAICLRDAGKTWGVEEHVGRALHRALRRRGLLRC